MEAALGIGLGDADCPAPETSLSDAWWELTSAWLGTATPAALRIFARSAGVAADMTFAASSGLSFRAFATAVNVALMNVPLYVK